MGTTKIDKRNSFSKKKYSSKTKGQRLGWESLKNSKNVKLEDVVDEGEVVPVAERQSPILLH